MIKQELNLQTLAIGDGANDVSMIQSSNVGVAIINSEGPQAVMASDFSIVKFRDLQRLLFIHGFWSQTRLVKVVLHFFYKNSSLIFVLFW